MNYLKLKYQKNFTWIYPLRYIIIAILLSCISIYIDTNMDMFKNYIPNILLISKNLSQTILTTLVSAIITITTFTFSTTMVVLTMYSSQFSPRVVQNFLSEKITLRVLGIFIGGFFFSLVSLTYMKDSNETNLYISASMGIIYAIICIIAFAFFIFKVSSSIQANNLLAKLYSQASDSINTAIKNHSEFAIKNSDKYLEDYKFTYIIPSKENGYIQNIDYSSILNSCEISNCSIEVKNKIGEFVVLGQPLAKLKTNKKIDFDGINFLTDAINKATIIETERNITYDYMFAILKIVDITLRAISPGINDPNTAIDCINILGILLSKMSKENKDSCLIQNEEKNTYIVYDYFDFKSDIYLTFYQILHYGKEDISIVIAILNALKNMSYNASDVNKAILSEFISYVQDNVTPNFNSNLDIEKIQSIKIANLD